MMDTLIFIGTQELILLLVMGLFTLIPLILVIVSLVDLFRRDFQDKTTDQVLYIILILLLPFIGSLIYLLALRKNFPLKNTRY